MRPVVFRAATGGGADRGRSAWAHMFPTTAPRETSAAEAQLFSLLATLPDEHRVFHGVRLRNSDQDGRILDKRGETMRMESDWQRSHTSL